MTTNVHNILWNNGEVGGLQKSYGDTYEKNAGSLLKLSNTEVANNIHYEALEHYLCHCSSFENNRYKFLENYFVPELNELGSIEWNEIPISGVDILGHISSHTPNYINPSEYHKVPTDLFDFYLLIIIFCRKFRYYTYMAICGKVVQMNTQRVFQISEMLCRHLVLMSYFFQNTDKLYLFVYFLCSNHQIAYYCEK